MKSKTLRYWHKLEHFYPYILKEQDNSKIKTISISSEPQFPDFQNPSVPVGKIVRSYAVYLGIFRMDSALVALEAGMQKPMKFRDAGDDESCFCKFALSSDGIFKTESFRISSFPWAVHRVRDGKIILDQWDSDFKDFELKMLKYLNDNKTSYTYDFLEDARKYFASQLNWNIDFSDCWLRIDIILKNDDRASEKVSEVSSDSVEENADEYSFEGAEEEEKNTDEAVQQNELLNSFYIRDLERIIQSLQTNNVDDGQAFERYLTYSSERQVDIEKDNKVLLDLMSPAHLPFGRWPSNYGMRFMQQVDVNTFMCKDPKYQQPLFSVNGPPGTGKTTLLKDIIAAIIVNRAMEMAKLDMPDDAFGKKVCSITYKTYTNDVKDIIPAIKNHGILVASNNNGAVENITNELPSMEELPERYRGSEYHYFSEVSDIILGEGKTWALNAASLGNNRKRTAFINKFWPLSDSNEKYDFNKELREKLKILSPEEWNKAKQSFLKALEAIKVEYACIQNIYDQTCLLFENKEKLASLEKCLENTETQLQKAGELVISYERAISDYKQRKELLLLQKTDLSSIDRFLWLKKWIWPSHSLVHKYREIEKLLVQNSLDIVDARENKFVASSQKQSLNEEKIALQEELKTIYQNFKKLEEALEAFRLQTDSQNRVDQYFIGNRDEEVSKSSPWGYSALNVLREKLFLEALQLHKVFVYNSRNLRENLDAFGKMMRGIPCGELSVAAPVLFQSLFLVVPVVSSTFASVGNFLKYIPKNEIAYLFVDEAGQAMPQSAVGAVWRAKKVIAVGDPLQIEPVATLHDDVIQILADYYQQSPLIADKYTSVQSLADLANAFGGYRTLVEENDLWIGAPLVVHNRCQRKVFRISNEIAYNGKMVYATKDRQDAVCRWINVKGNSQNGHFVPNQAIEIEQIVVDSFKAFAQTDRKLTKVPSLFLITPFRSVRSGMIDYFRNKLPNLFIQHGLDITKKELRDWIRTSIGTIHTFQGMQADTVVLCLGVGSDGKNTGAVNWASNRPNILNVAVTRSKVQLYIVGDKNLWSDKPYFDRAYSYCDVEQK